MHATVFSKISERLLSKYFRKTLQQMLQLTSLQMRQIILDCGGDTDWIASLEEMLGASFAASIEDANTAAVIEEKKQKTSNTNLRISKFLSEEDQTLGHYLFKNNMLEQAILDDWVFDVVKTPNPESR